MFEQYIQNNYLRTLIIFLISFLVLRIALFIFQKITLKLTSKTKTKLDDILLAKLSSPLTVISFLISLIISIPELNLTNNIESTSINIIYSTMVVVFAYLTYVITDIVIITALKKLTSKTKSNADDSLISLFHSVLNTTLIIISALYILSLWGVEITPLLAGLGIAGLAVALALQPVLANVFSGAAIILDHSVRVGDLVYLDAQTRGKIEKVGLRSTRIRTFDNELIIIPNTKLAESTIQNVALPEPRVRVVIPFGVAYGTDIDKVKKIVLKEISSIKESSKEKKDKPIVRFLEMADSSLNFKAYFYIDSFEDRARVTDEANTKIYNALNKAKIEIPFPQVDVNLKK